MASEQGYTAYVDSAIHPFELGTLMNPLALGFPRESLSQENSDISTYWPLYLKSGANYAESAVCLGPFILAMWVVSTGVTGGCGPGCGRCGDLPALYWHFRNRLLYFGVPGWSASGSPAVRS